MTEALSFRGRQPTELAFGTSGLRGLVTDITDLEAYINTSGFLAYSLATQPDVPRRVVIGGDRRPSTDSGDRSIMRAVARACVDAGFQVENAGKLPTPALAYFAFQQGVVSIMVTGSHIPFDRNGIKFNMPGREVLKSDEPGILHAVSRFRAVEYEKAADESCFDDAGMFRPGQASSLPDPTDAAERAYVQRYAEFFPDGALSGLRVAVYQHSAVGRDLLVQMLERLGATVYAIGRSEQFVAIDTEAIDSARLAELEQLYADVRSKFGPVDVIVSTDGDSDRPLVLGIDSGQNVQFVPGDVLGILVADYLGAEAVAVPVSATDAIEKFFRGRVELVRTKIGSPWVIAAMQRLTKSSRVGWEANGGFLVGSSLERQGRHLAPLATRDAFLPILSLLHAARIQHKSIVELCARLPERHGSAGLIDVVEPVGALLERYLVPSLAGLVSVSFEGTPRWYDANGEEHAAESGALEQLLEVRGRLADHFSPGGDPDAVSAINFVDGIRCYLKGGDIAHVRASGNAPQLRLYAVSDSGQRAQALVAEAVRPGGTLARLVSEAEQYDFVRRVQNNIAYTQNLFQTGTPARVIGTVSGSLSAQRFWQQALNEMKGDFRADRAISFHEDLPTNQALGLLLLWQRLKPHLPAGAGALVAFVFGEGSRATPFTETDNGQKPAIASFVRRRGAGDPRGFESMVGLALRCFAPVENYLRRSGFDGLVVKWGDEVQIPALDLSLSDPLFENADVVRFVSMRSIDENSAIDKDWVGVDASGRVTAFIPRRPFGEMQGLAERGLLQVRSGELFGGVNLGSIAVSRRLLDALLSEFSVEVNDETADRKARPDLDPQFFTAFMLALIDDDTKRKADFEQSIAEVPALAKLAKNFPDLLSRLRKVVTEFRVDHGQSPRVVAMNFGAQYWGDIGQHRQIYEFYMALNQSSPDGRIARALAGIEGAADARGNRVTPDSVVAPGIELQRSVVIGCELLGRGVVKDSVLIGTRARDISAEAAFDVLSVVRDLKLGSGAGSYKVVSDAAVEVASNERVTTLFLPDGRQLLMRVAEATDLRDRRLNYEAPVLDNPLSFARAHELMCDQSVDELRARRAEAAASVLQGIAGIDQ